MAWKKSKPRKNQRRYKRFSSSAIKTSASGPSVKGVFPGGRLIPEDSKAVFDYRNRGTRSERDVAHEEWLMKVFNIDDANVPVRDHERPFLKRRDDPRLSMNVHFGRHDALNKAELLTRLSQVEFMWTGELRRHKIHTWNSIFLDKSEFWEKLFFSGNHYVLLVHSTDGMYRRSIVYTNRDTLMRDRLHKVVVWAEFFDPASEPTLSGSLPDN